MQQQAAEEQGHGIVTIRDIRLFGRSWTPETFAGLGWRGWWLNVLNGLRWRLEVRVQWHAQYLLKSRLGTDVDRLWEEWKRDLYPPTRMFTDRDVPMHPEGAAPATVLGGVKKTNDTIARLIANPRSKRYANGRRRFVMYDLEAVEEQPNAENTTTGDGRIAAGSEDGKSNSRSA